jgi:glycosyltransferase involved in cell wall biosynthesis
MVLLETAQILEAAGHGDIKFVFVGDGPEKEHLVAQAQAWALRNVQFESFVKKAEVPAVLGTASAVIFNLEVADVFKYGISSNKLFDYMASSRPVISAVKAANNPVEKAKCGFCVPPRDPHALAGAIMSLYGMPLEEREAMGRRGRAFVEKYHAIPVLADRLEQVLSKATRGL